MLDEALLESVRHELTHAQRVIVVSHVRPDGDAVGSVLALGLALEAAGKQVQMVLADGVPLSFRNTPGASRVVRKPRGDADLTFVVDCSDLERVGSALEDYAPDVNIDHHPTNLNFARINLVAPDAVSTTEILGQILEPLGLPVTPAVAEALTLGLITDTLGFQTSNMRASALRMAADMMERYRVDLPRIYGEALIDRQFAALKYWGLGLSRVAREGKLIWTSLTLRDREEAGYPGRDDADLISVLKSVSEVDVAVIFVEQHNDKVKISWRARPGYDTSKIALKFGGGGHKAASGAEVEGGLEKVQAEVLEATRTLFSENSHPGPAEPDP